MEEDDLPTEFRFQYRLATPMTGLVLSSALLGVIASQYSPASGPIVIIAFLCLVFIFFISLTAIIVQVILRLARQQNFTPVRLFYVATSVATGGVFLVGLQTLRQLQIIDIILVAALEAVLLFYLFRRF